MVSAISSSAGSSGFTLPVWVAASARAATEILGGKVFNPKQKLFDLDHNKSLIVPVSSAVLLSCNQKAMAISHCESALPLDITRNLEVWTFVQLQQKPLSGTEKLGLSTDSWLQIVGGFGVGKVDLTNQISISKYAVDLLKYNLRSLVPNGFCLKVEVIFPKGTELAQRTSNQAFGVVEGLALIGTQAHPEVSASPEQLEAALDQIRLKCASSNFSGTLALVVGENGFDLAIRLGFSIDSLVKVGNWIGPALVEAAKRGVKELLLFGYHGKLIKLAGGIFHTHNHLADARIEILTSLAVQEEIASNLLKEINQSDSVEAAWCILAKYDSLIANDLWRRMAVTIENKSFSYITRYGDFSMSIGVALFDRSRKLRWAGQNGLKQLPLFGASLDEV